MTTRTVPTRTAVRVLAALAAVATVAGAHTGPAAAATTAADRPAGISLTAASVPDAMTIAKRMARHRNVYMSNPVDEGPDTVVRGGLCVRLAEAGCEQMVATKDASVMVFGTTRQADDYAGHADDTASAYGRMVLSFGSPARVVEEQQGRYERVLMRFRRTHPAQKNDAAAAVKYLDRRGLLMRDPHFEDERGERLGRASRIPGAVDMVGTDQADVIVFKGRAAAAAYVANADDQAYRYGRVVLSFGNPPRVVPESQPRYERVLRKVLS